MMNAANRGMLYLRLRALYVRIIRVMPPKKPGVLRKLAYTDVAMTPVSEHEVETHELFNSEAAQHDLAAEFLLEKREVLRTQRVASQRLSSGELVDEFYVRRRA